MSEEALIVADRGPLIALPKIGQLTLLDALYADVRVPSWSPVSFGPVDTTSRHDVARRVLDAHPWLRVGGPAKQADAALLAALDPGEAAAIALAIEMRAPILIDERKGRRIASAVYGLDVRGTLGTLVRARRSGLIGLLRPLLDRLVASGDHLSAELVREVLQAVGEAE